MGDKIPSRSDLPMTWRIHDVRADEWIDVPYVTSASYDMFYGGLDLLLTVEVLDTPETRSIDPDKRLLLLYFAFESGKELGPFMWESTDHHDAITYHKATDEDAIDVIEWRLYGPFRQEEE